MVLVRLLGILWILTTFSGSLGAQETLRTEFQDTQPKFIQGTDGRFSGLCVETMDLVGRRAGVKFSYPPAFVPITRIEDDLKDGAIDVYFGLSKDAPRIGQMIFVGELFTTRYQLVTRKGDPTAEFTRLDQLRDSRIPILVIRGAAPALYFQSIPGLVFTEAPGSVAVALRKLKSGDGRLFGYYDLGLNWQMQTEEFHNALATVPVKFDTAAQWMCVRKGLPDALVSRLNEALTTVKSSPEWPLLLKKYFLGNP